MSSVKFRTIISIAVIIAVGAPYCSDAGFGYLIAVVSLQVVTLLLAIAALIFYMMRRGLKDHPHRMAKWLATVALALFLQTISLPILGKMEQNRIRAGKNYCESLIAGIEQYRLVNDIYPESLAQLTPISPAPSFLRNQQFYRAWPDDYSFNFHTPGSFMMSYHYDRREKKWEAFD
ncbi:MAG: hypothetical protein KKG47_09225 [Proteobacteria bacterium]|nr:hypothetical protein [Pseudomonadota bacterium]MBU1737155.1 hypothetical protein [Pseudomonadota bacterium]